MNTRTTLSNTAELSLVPASKGETLNAELPGDFLDLWSRAMDQAIGIEEASLASVVRLSSDVTDIYQNALWFAPIRALTSFMELQLNWLTMFTHIAKSSSNSGVAPAAAEETDRSMDIVIGAQFTPEPLPDVPEFNEEVAIGRAA